MSVSINIQDIDGYELARVHESEHRIRNSLQLLSVLTRRQLLNAKGTEAREALAYVNELVAILRNLHVDMGIGGRDTPADRLRAICRNLQRLCGGHIEIAVDADDTVSLPDDQLTNASLIALELVINAIKHAFPDGRRGAIRVSLKPGGPGCASLVVMDDGVGLAATSQGRPDQADTPHEGTGLVETLVAALGGTQKSGAPGGKGHSVSIRWPL